MEEIKQTISSLLEQWEAKQHALKQEDPQVWLKKALTKKELRHIKVDYFRRGILGVSVDSSAWLYTLGMRKEELLGKMRRESGSIKDIHLHIGDV